MSSRDDYKVPARSWASISASADRVRKQLALTKVPYMPVIEVIEQVLDQQLDMTRFLVGSHVEMQGAEGYTCPDGEFIMLREDVYEGVCSGEARDRFTTAHELGHWVMHTKMPLARVKRGDGTKPYMLAEPQANQFAASLLMPKSFISASDTETELMERFGVSYDAARVRLEWLKKNREL